MHASSEPVVDTPENPNDISISDAETQSRNEHEPTDNINEDVHDDAQPSNDNDIETEPVVDLDNPSQVVKVDSLYRYDKVEIPSTKFASQCLDEFDDFMARQENFNAYVGRELKSNAYMIEHLGDYMSRVKGELKLISKHASMVTTQVEQVLKAQSDLLDELNNKHDFAVRVATRTGKMTQEPLYPKGHPKRIEQDSRRNNLDAPSPSKKKKKNDRTLHSSSEPVVDTPKNPNDISISDAETQSDDEHEPSDNVNDNVHVDAQPSNNNDVEIEPTVDLDNPQSKNQRYDKRDFVARKHGK